jgi:hypothetical protein
MKLTEYIDKVIGEYKEAVRTGKTLPAGLGFSDKSYAPPAGWFTVEQIRAELNLAYTRNASSRALDLHRRGVLDRQPHQSKAKTGQCHMTYVYRPKAPFKTITEACQRVAAVQSDKVPKGWVRLVDHAKHLRISDVALRNRVARAGLQPKYFKTSRGVSGLHLNAYYSVADLRRVCR